MYRPKSAANLLPRMEAHSKIPSLSNTTNEVKETVKQTDISDIYFVVTLGMTPIIWVHVWPLPINQYIGNRAWLL